MRRSMAVPSAPWRPPLPAESPPLRPAAAPEPDRKLTLILPAAVVRQLRLRVAREETTLRALVLEALAEAGYRVPAGEIRDRRRRPAA